jgi:diguanylate cyclase (GGDEF)-like protein
MKKGQTLLKILVCDDDPQDRKLIRAYLHQKTDREIAIMEAGQPAEIQTALDKGRVDLVLMDIQMPEKSGMEWLKEIVEKQVAPVVMLTGYGNEEIAVQSLQQGAIGYLPKARLSTEKLVGTICEAMEKWRGLILSRADQEQVARLVNFDSLTGLFNRRAILEMLDGQIAHVRRYGDKLSVLMMDIDYFKGINDTYGHMVGDDVLEKVAALLQRKMRDTNTAGRYGGDEFVITLPKTDLSSAVVVAERIRKVIKTTKMKDPWGNVFGVTVSQGLTTYEPGDEIASLISRADDALYRAKHNGRDRVETSDLITSGI